MIKAITLWQPWASLVGRGKMIETRGYPTRVRGWVAIHAAKKWDFENWQFLNNPLFFKALTGRDIHSDDREVCCAAWDSLLADMPKTCGCVVAVARLVDCKMILSAGTNSAFGQTTSINPPSEPELSFGNYEPGRYGWIFDEVRHLPEPIPAKGKQGWWLWEPPESVKMWFRHGTNPPGQELSLTARSSVAGMLGMDSDRVVVGRGRRAKR